MALPVGLPVLAPAAAAVDFVGLSPLMQSERGEMNWMKTKRKQKEYLRAESALPIWKLKELFCALIKFGLWKGWRDEGEIYARSREGLEGEGKTGGKSQPPACI